MIHLGLLVVAGAVLIYLNRGQWFFGDEWEFLVNRGFVDARLGLLYPHNEHWSTLPILAFSVLRNTVGLVSYWPYVAVLVAVHLALAHVLWRVMLRSGALPAVATATAALFSVIGAGAENLLWAFQIGFVGSVALGWAGALVAATDDRRPGRRDVWAVLLLVGSLMCSGIGIPMVVIAVVAVWGSSRALWRPLVVGGVPAVVFLLWYLLIGRRPAGPGTGADSPLDAVTTVANGLTHMVASVLGTPALLSAAVVVALALWSIWAGVRVARSSTGSATEPVLALAGVVGVGAFGVIIALGRGEFESSRYLYIAVAMALPAAALALTALCRWRWVQAVVAVAVLAVAVHNVQVLKVWAANDAGRETWIRDTVQSAAALVEAGTSTVAIQPEPTYDPDLSVDALRTFAARNGLPTSASERGTLAARLALQVALVAPGSRADATIATVTARDGVVKVDGPGDCVVPDTTGEPGVVVVDPDGGTQVLVLRSEDDADATYELVLGDGAAAPPARTVTVAAGTEWELLTNLPDDGPDLTIRPMTTGSAVCTAPRPRGGA